MASDDDYTSALITAVAKRPLLYNVHLADYKNKNKKGEAFKEVQQEMRQAGCNEQQVQGTYKKWISLKRKFRVEFFKVKAECGSEAADTLGISSYKFYDDLKFLIPYCEFYKNSKISGKRKFCLQSSLPLDEEESDEERGVLFDDDEFHRESTLDQLLNQKRTKPEILQKDIDALATSLTVQNSSSSTTDGSNRTPSPLLQNPLTAENGSFDQQNLINPLNLLSQHEIDSFQQKCQELDKSCFPMDSTNLLFAATPPSQNALFGQLVANELDKLAETTNINLVRAQLLLLLAQAANNSSANFSNAATENLLTNLNKSLRQ